MTKFKLGLRAVLLSIAILSIGFAALPQLLSRFDISKRKRNEIERMKYGGREESDPDSYAHIMHEIKSSTFSSLKEPKLVYARYYRHPKFKTVLWIEWISRAPTANSLCIRFTNGDATIVRLNAAQLVENNETAKEFIRFRATVGQSEIGLDPSHSVEDILDVELVVDGKTCSNRMKPTYLKIK